MCGEHSVVNDAVSPMPGSSPHVRGALSCGIARVRSFGIIPACAGSTIHAADSSGLPGDHPRMCGEHYINHHNASISSGSSPHVRGARQGRFGGYRLFGIIPACAGSTSATKCRQAPSRDHPRMCGEHKSIVFHAGTGQGSSPHVRGAHFENSIIPRKRKDNWLFFIQFRFENFLAFRYLLALLHPFLGVPTKDPSFASLGRLINCNPSQSTGDQSAPYTLKAICCSFLAE